MLRQLMLAKRLEQRKIALDKLLKRETDLQAEVGKLAAALEEAAGDKELDVVEAEITKLSDTQAELANEKHSLEIEIAKIEEELKSIQANAPGVPARSKGGSTVGKELRDRLALYVRTKGRVLRETPVEGEDGIEGFKVVDGGVLVPEEILSAEEFKRDVVDLAKYVRVVKVNRGSGKIPVIKKSGSVMYTVDELEENPELAKPEIDDIAYDIETYRGYIPVSQEVIDDADYDIIGLVRDEIADQELNTRNTAIADVLKDASAKTATGLDGLKAVLNVELKRVYNAKLFVSASLYNELDTVKDRNGRYLLQDSITSPSGKSFAGREVIVLDDDLIGEEKGDLVAFIGDAREYVALFDRKRASVKWIDNNIYGELLASFVRFDVGVVDEDAGFYVTYEPEGEEEDTGDGGN